MKKFFLSVVICLLAVTSMTAKTISIPTDANCAAAVTSVTRSMELKDGDEVFVGEKLHITYTLLNALNYYLTGDAEVDVTLAEEDFVSNVYTVVYPCKLLPFPTLTIKPVDQETFSFKWTNSQLFDTIRICVQEESITSFEPAEQKGWKDVSGDSTYVAYGLTPGKTYAVAVRLQTAAGGYRLLYQTFINAALPTRCGLVIKMKDSYGDGWNGAQLIFRENGEEQIFEVMHEDRKNEVTANYSSKGDMLEIYWKKGGYNEECSFSVTDAYGNVLIEKKLGECASLSDGELLFQNIICQPKCKPTFYFNSFKNGQLLWHGEDVTGFDLAFLRKSNPTDEEIEAAMIHIEAEEAQTDFAYEAQQDSSVAVIAFLRAYCSNGEHSDWIRQAATYTYEPSKPENELAKPITLNHYERNDLISDANVWYNTPATERLLTLEEPTFVRFEMYTEVSGMTSWLWDVANDDWKDLKLDTSLYLAAGQYAYEVRGSSVEYGEYDAFVSRTDTNSNILKQPFDSIALGQTKTGSTKDMLRIGKKSSGYYSQNYRFILTDTTEVHISCTNGKDSYVGFALFQDDSQIAGGYDEVFKLPNDTFLIQVWADRPGENFTLKVEQNNPKQLSIIDIKPDVVKEGTIEANDWNGYGRPMKVYRYTPSNDEILLIGIDTLAGSAALKVAYVQVVEDSLYGHGIGGAYYSESQCTVLEVKKDVPYYFLVYGGIGTQYKLSLKRNAANYDSPKITGTIQVNKKYTANYTSADPTTICYDYVTKTKFYKVHLEKNKYYYVLAESDDNVYSEFALFHPDSATGSFYGNIYNGNYSTTWHSGEAAYVAPFYIDSTADYIFLANLYEEKNFEPRNLSFEIDELVSFTDAVDNAPAVNTPIIEHSTMEGKVKVAYDDSYKFFSSSEEGVGIAYNAVVYNVIVKKNRDFTVRFGGNFDAKIFVYDSENMTSPLTADNFKDNTQEALYVSSAYSAPHIYTVVCAFRGLMLDNPIYDLEILQEGEEEAELVVVTPVADRRSLSCNENDTWREVKNRLSKIYLFAVDSKKNYLFPIANEEQNWEIDLDGQMAHYEVNNNDMHPGYKLANPVEWIDVALTFDNDIPFAIDEVEGGMAPIKVIRDGKLYIITQYGTFDIMGRKVK